MPHKQSESSPSRRAFLSRLGLGATALSTMLACETRPAAGGDITGEGPTALGALPGLPHFPAQAKNVIYLFQSGAPSQLDLFDHKPNLSELRGVD